MKHFVILIALLAISFAGFAQKTVKSPKLKTDTVAKYQPAADKKFSIEFTANELAYVLSSAQYGFQPFIKTTTTPVNQVDQLQQSFAQLLQDKFIQFKKQCVADSLEQIQQKALKRK